MFLPAWTNILISLYTPDLDLEHQGITPNNDQSQDNDLNPVTAPASGGFDDSEDGLRVLAKIIARRHIRNQLNKIKGRTDKKSINHDNDNKTSNG